MGELADLITRQASRFGTAPFLALPSRNGSAPRSIGYTDVASATAWWATVLREDLEPDAAVALLISDPIDFAVAYLGVVASGRTAMPIDPRLPAQSRRQAIYATGADGVISDLDVSDGSDGEPKLLTWKASSWSGRHADQSTPVSVNRSGSVELRSSGTTGPPKRVRLTEEQLLVTARAVAAHHGFGPGERGYCPLPLFHINAEVVGVLATLSAGGELVLDHGFHRSHFWSVVRDCAITWINAAPAILTILAADESGPAGPVDRVRFIRSASAPLPVAVRRRFEDRFGIPVIESYGMTEAGSQITVNPLDGPRKPGSAGIPVGTEMQIRDESGRELPPEQTGSVTIRGAGVIRSYAGVAGNERIDAEGWLDTGDIGYRDRDGYLYLVGRRDDVINRGGEKVFPREVEEVLVDHPGVADAVVVGAPDDVLGQVPHAFVVLSSQAERDQVIAALRRRCDESLARYQRPTAYRVLDKLPTGATGKVSRRLVRESEMRVDG